MKALMRQVVFCAIVLALAAPAAAAPVNYFNNLYTGTRDDYNGQVGFEFQATSSFYVDAIGRAVNPSYNGGVLQRDHVVRLWDVPTQSMLAEVTIDNASPRDGLGYATEPVASSVPIAQGRLYRLTTHEYSGGGDPWFSGSLATASYRTDLATLTTDAYINNYTGYPSSGTTSKSGYGVPTFVTDPATTVAQAGENFYNVNYTGTQNTHSGQIGAEFVAYKDLEIRALGRAASPVVNGGTLVDSHTLRLWDADTQALLGEVVVDGNSPYDASGYAQGLLPSPVSIGAGQRFVVSTTETNGGADPWYTAKQDRDPMTDHLNVASVRRDAYTTSSTGFPSSNNHTGDAYGAVTFFGDLAPDRQHGFNIFDDHYSGDRNSYDGRVGFAFVAQSDFVIDRLGRAVSPRYHDGELAVDHTVELWRQDGTSSGVLLGSVTVGPDSPRDEMGYAFEWLDENLQLVEGQAYRLVTTEFSTGTAGDPWRDQRRVPLYDHDLIQITGTAHGGYTGFPGSDSSFGEYAFGAPTFYVTPEPGTIGLLLCGALGLVLCCRRSNRR